LNQNYISTVNHLSKDGLRRTSSSLIVAGKDISKYIGKEINVIGWIVTSKRVRTKKGDQMKFLTMEDKTASFEVTLFPKVYRECGHVLMERGPYVVKGKVEDEFGGITVTANSLKRAAAIRND